MENESYQAILEKRQASNFSSPKSTGTNDNVGLQQQLFPRSALLSSFNENPWGLRSQFSPQPTLQTTTTQQASNSNASYQSQFMKQFHPPLLTSMNSAAGTQRSPSVVSSSSPSSSMATPSFYNPHAMTSSQPVIIRPPQNPPQTPTHHQQQESSTLDEWLGMFGDPSEDDILGSLIGEIHQTLQNNF
ncbi:hypothetical protein C9374_007814 [Naegleria lovaniensis]|uniref:Uncharacterized protein n=1 Tax=Naegleria lovaniensis TaxID=51637 RepID=A0AA88GLG3_NAELO|nr:uncharacterized protein C9374_007814 [Naegleria lovaniensis]KAG2378666.1 hypothetical protein C9374_007814 [Naegleria lovaniensis]